MQAAAFISQDMTNLKQASARVTDLEGSLLSGELWSSIQNIYYYYNSSVPHTLPKMAAVSPHLYLSFLFCCCVVCST